MAARSKKPTRVGEYILGRTLGKGSFGQVKIARHVTTNETVAIKIVLKSTIVNVEEVERVYRETFILKSLDHRNIIRLFDVIDTPHALYLVTEYADGGELHDHVKAIDRMDEETSCKMFHQIMAGVVYCHRKKIIHRDLKLENILLDKSGTIKIADFGLSNSIKFGQKMQTNCGTPSYTPPEKITEKMSSGEPEDIWSMGVILFAMTCGYLPFEAESVPALYKKIKNRRFQYPSFVSQEFADLLDRMLTLDPVKRATLSEIRSNAWFLMHYNPALLAKLRVLPAPKSSDIDEARRLNMEFSETERDPTGKDRDREGHSHTHSGKGARPSTRAHSRSGPKLVERERPRRPSISPPTKLSVKTSPRPSNSLDLRARTPKDRCPKSAQPFGKDKTRRSSRQPSLTPTSFGLKANHMRGRSQCHSHFKRGPGPQHHRVRSHSHVEGVDGSPAKFFLTPSDPRKGETRRSAHGEERKRGAGGHHLPSLSSASSMRKHPRRLKHRSVANKGGGSLSAGHSPKGAKTPEFWDKLPKSPRYLEGT